MTGMFGGARWRMVGWSILVLSAILLVISATLYVSLDRTLRSSVDAQLQTASESARMELVESGGGISDAQLADLQAYMRIFAGSRGRGSEGEREHGGGDGG